MLARLAAGLFSFAPAPSVVATRRRGRNTAKVDMMKVVFMVRLAVLAISVASYLFVFAWFVF